MRSWQIRIRNNIIHVGKTICGGWVYSRIYSFRESGNNEKCPFCNADRSKTDEEIVEKIMKRVEANDATAIYVLGSYYNHGLYGLQQDRTKAIGLMTKAAELVDSDAHNQLGNEYRERGDLKKATFHTEAAAMAGHEVARYNLGITEARSGNLERAVKHWIIAASAGEHQKKNSF